MFDTQQNKPSPAQPATPQPPEAPPPAPAPAPPPPAAPERAEAEAAIHGQAREALGALQTDVQKDYDDFLAFIEEEGIDFAANRANQIIVENLQSFLQENQSDAPAKFQQEWRSALIEFLKSEMRSADEPMSDIKIDESNEMVRKMKDANSGVGAFEPWFQKNHPAECKAWKGAKAEAERKRQEAEKTAQEAERQRQETERQRQEAERQTQTAEQQRQETERQRQEQAGLEAAEEADAPFLDRLNATVSGMEEGKWKTVATKLAAALTGLFVMLSKAPLIGGWVRRNFISNKTLARLGDKNAEMALKAEEQFRKLGLSRDLANELGGKKTKDVVALIKDPQKLASLATDTAVQGKLTTLATQIADKGGGASEVTLFEFMGNNPNWPGVTVAAAAPAAATVVVGGAPAPEAISPAIPPETPEAKISKIFGDMSGDARVALENAKVKDVAAGTLPATLQTNERAKKIAAKLKANGGDQVMDANRTVKQFLEGNLDKDWTLA